MELKEEEILLEKKGRLGIISLNRPAKLNSLTRNLTKLLRSYLKQCEEDNNISMILLRGNGEKAFSAGGDLVSTQKIVQEEGLDAGVEALKGEYSSAFMLAKYSKPTIAYMDGITMGGGAGLAMACDVRIATERTKWAMPEMKIGLFPDVGLSYFFARMPFALGRYLAITSKTITAEDCCFSKIANSKIRREEEAFFLEELIALSEEKIEEKDREKEMRVKKVLELTQKYSTEQTISSLEKKKQEIERIFSRGTMQEIWNSLREESNASSFAKETIESMWENSPLSMKITWEQIQRAEKMSLEDCYKMDSILAKNFLKGNDVYEGIRAILLDRTRDAVWEYASLEEVPQEVVDSYFKK